MWHGVKYQQAAANSVKGGERKYCETLWRKESEESESGIISYKPQRRQ